jgi:hypothetical protein
MGDTGLEPVTSSVSCAAEETRRTADFRWKISPFAQSVQKNPLLFVDNDCVVFSEVPESRTGAKTEVPFSSHLGRNDSALTPTAQYFRAGCRLSASRLSVVTSLGDAACVYATGGVCDQLSGSADTAGLAPHPGVDAERLVWRRWFCFPGFLEKMERVALNVLHQ